MTQEQAEKFVAFDQKFKQASPLFRMSEQLTLMPYIYGDEITEFIKFCYDNKLVTKDYDHIKNEWQENKTNEAWFANLTEEKLVQCIGYIIRGDRFCDGLLASTITNGTLSQLFERVKALHNV